jgi:phosphate transport system permease protein
MTDVVNDKGSKRDRPSVAYVRPKQTPAMVRIADKTADWVISIGGLFVILAVAGIMIFLIQVVVPLFTGGDLRGTRTYTLAETSSPLVAVRIDDTNSVALELFADGKLAVLHLPTGQHLDVPALELGGKSVTAFADTINGDNLALGFDDGSVRFGELSIRGLVIPASEAPANLTRLSDTSFTDGSAIFETLGPNRYRRLSISAIFGDAQTISETGQAIRQIDYRVSGTSERPTRGFVTVDDAGVLRYTRAETRMNLLTRSETVTVQSSTLPGTGDTTPVTDILLTGQGDQVYVAHTSGFVFRYDTRNPQAASVVESRDLTVGDANLTRIGFLIGEQAIVVGGSDGSVNVFSRIQTPDARTPDGYSMVLMHPLDPQSAAITGLAVSARNKMFLTSDASGAVWVRHSTSEQVLMRLRGEKSGARFETMSVSPRSDGVLAVASDRTAQFWRFDIPHPETTLGTIFGKVWYEGFPKPEYSWQSSSGNDDFEPKLSLIPLIFGTIKGTIYSLLFAVPIALMAAIFTAEFVHPRVRNVVKPAMEMMASLPSVVLGFIAALILAPVVESFIAAVVLGFVAVPMSLFAAAFLWQLLPEDAAIRFGGLTKLVLIFIVLGLGLWLSVLLAPGFEHLFFSGDFQGWVNGTVGGGTAFLTLLLLPLAYIAVSMVAARTVGPALQQRIRALPRSQGGVLDGLRWLVLLAASVVLALVLASLFTGAGFDPRGGVFDTYVQRNTLVVGFAMGFAVIPIIYTIAEDALTAVPEHLRAASLACGATRWQTATRIILPTAMSGIFAAVMVGMGRAVGETMIVVMAAGNTPVLDWNLFNGLRALSANIAVELPEAVVDSTLYRMLFLAALTLFVMTFILNTIAELIRQRFRKRAVQL